MLLVEVHLLRTATRIAPWYQTADSSYLAVFLLLLTVDKAKAFTTGRNKSSADL